MEFVNFLGLTPSFYSRKRNTIYIYFLSFFQRCVVVQEVFPEGLIAQDGRLRPGDQIIEINGVDMTCANHLQVIFQEQ